MNDNFIITLLEKFDASSVKELFIEKDGVKINFNKNSSAQAISYTPGYATASTPENIAGTAALAGESQASTTSPTGVLNTEASATTSSANIVFIKSPIVGTFYRAPSPDSPAYAEKGKTVKKGQPLCILEAMKMMNTLEAEYDCVIEDILVVNGDLVEFDQNLFKVKKL